jgi:predicted site-specific integrase-resolvase
METHPVINTAEARAMLGGVDRSTLKRWVDDGKLTPLRKLPGETGGYLFDRAEVERFATERAAAAS